MSIQSFCGRKQNSTASHFHYEKKINTMPSQKTHLLCDLRSDASDNKQSLDMSRKETRTQDNFITGRSSYISLCQTLYVAKDSLSFTKSSRTSEVNIERVWTHNLLYEGLSTTPTALANVKETWQFETRHVILGQKPEKLSGFENVFLKRNGLCQTSQVSIQSLQGFQRLPQQRKDKRGKEDTAGQHPALNRHWYFYYDELNGILR